MAVCWHGTSLFNAQRDNGYIAHTAGLRASEGGMVPANPIFPAGQTAFRPSGYKPGNIAIGAVLTLSR